MDRARISLLLLLIGLALLIAPESERSLARAELNSEKQNGTLSFAERVAYQYAIEEVYWRHRIWPKDNHGPKPSLDELVSAGQIEGRVADYLRQSQLLEQRQQPITPEQLQAKMDRMAHDTQNANVLRELFAALGNDPFLVAECLARPLLAEWLVSEQITHDGVEAFVSNASTSHPYNLPEISAPLDCSDDTWTATATVNGPDAREGHTAVWTGSEMIIWGGKLNNSQFVNTGARYNPATDNWTATSIANAPVGRSRPTAVWTGREIIIWGGANPTSGQLNTGGIYNAITDSWTVTSTANAPAQRVRHTAVWTGSEMIVWGGFGCGGNCKFNSGGRYNPTTDSWTATSIFSVPAARWNQQALWTGNEMIIWGGTDDTNYLNTGGRYYPASDRWTPYGSRERATRPNLLYCSVEWQ